LGPKVSLLANARLPLRRHSAADFSNAPRFIHFRQTMLKYVDVYRYSDGVALIGHRHNRPGADNSALRPACELSERGRYKAGPTVRGAKAGVHMPACLASSFPGLFSRWTGTFDARDLWVMSQPLPLSRGLAILKHAGYDRWRCRAVARDLMLSGPFHGVSFTNPFTTRLCKSAQTAYPSPRGRLIRSAMGSDRCRLGGEQRSA
jgi:hypothetical protein